MISVKIVKWDLEKNLCNRKDGNFPKLNIKGNL